MAGFQVITEGLQEWHAKEERLRDKLLLRDIPQSVEEWYQKQKNRELQRKTSRFDFEMAESEAYRLGTEEVMIEAVKLKYKWGCDEEPRVSRKEKRRRGKNHKRNREAEMQAEIEAVRSLFRPQPVILARLVPTDE